MSSALFTPIALRGLELKNRIVVAPMCQYSAENGAMSDWHVAHLTSLACSGAGLLVIEMTNVESHGRISVGCVGLYSDECEAGMKRAISVARRWGQSAIGIQLAHAGRKASAHKSWDGGGPLKPEEGAWRTVSASPLPFGPGWPAPHELTATEVNALVEAFAASARRADRLGLDAAELHGAHGYLLHQFLSPLSNKRSDEWGGTPEKRMRFPLQVVEAVRRVWPQDKPLGMRITCNEWVADGLTPDDAVALARAVKPLGVDFLCCSGGGNTPNRPAAWPGYMVEYAAKVKREAGIATRAVGLIVTPKQAEEIVAAGQADMVALARGFLDDPHWGWHAAEALGAAPMVPPQYGRGVAPGWPGAKLARPQA